MNDRQKQFKDMVSMFIVSDDNLTDEIIDNKIAEIRGLPTFSVLTDAEVAEVSAAIKSEVSIKLVKGELIEEKGHQRWFLAKKASLDMKYWERYRKYLLADSGFSTKVVNTMDDMLDTLTDLLGDPTRDVAYSRRGLIIGDVQSGKTANYTGLICKAADSGYKVIVLLTGTLEKLRQQTQQRIDEGFVGSNSDAMMKQKRDQLIIGAGKYDSSVRPMVLTSTMDDFKAKNASSLGFDLQNINGSVIFVIKKNSSVLKRLNKWFKLFNQDASKKINHSLLVIDDESDNASVNTKADPDETPTAINGQIREMLNLFTKSSYVGFTATPFANIFIDPDNYNAMVAEDLFPKNYIYNLNAPSNYTGARNIFNEDGNSAYMLATINDDENDPDSIASILPLSHKPTVIFSKMPSDLKSAVAAFMLANTIEDIRGLTGTHRSMLINISRLTNVQEQIGAVVNEYLKDMQAACRNYSKLPVESALKSELIAFLHETYTTVYKNIDIPWETIQNNLLSSCAGIVLQIFNRNAGQNVNYSDYKDGLRVIAVGGMSLSRGLTLEGLVVSYFYRNSKMYDTLMQMGRWFGYRGKYADLCRIWMTNESIEWYRQISQATDELREEIKRYQDTGLTPMDFGLRVRSDITALLITARNKMRSAESRECVISLSGEAIETPEIYADKAKNDSNLEAVRRLIATLNSSGCTLTTGKKCGYLNVDKDIIIDFLNQLDISPKNVQFTVSAITKFIKDYRGDELSKWDIAFASGKSDTDMDLGYGVEYTCPERKFTVVNDGKIIKVSGSKRRLGTSADGVFGLTDSQLGFAKSRALLEEKSSIPQKDYFRGINRHPLLTIYTVKLNGCAEDTESAKSAAKPYINTIAVGFGIGIPSLADNETKYARYYLNKIAIQQMFAGEDIDGEDDD